MVQELKAVTLENIYQDLFGNLDDFDIWQNYCHEFWTRNDNFWGRFLYQLKYRFHIYYKYQDFFSQVLVALLVKLHKGDFVGLDGNYHTNQLLSWTRKVLYTCLVNELRQNQRHDTHITYVDPLDDKLKNIPDAPFCESGYNAETSKEKLALPVKEPLDQLMESESALMATSILCSYKQKKPLHYRALLMQAKGEKTKKIAHKLGKSHGYTRNVLTQAKNELKSRLREQLPNKGLLE